MTLEAQKPTVTQPTNQEVHMKNVAGVAVVLSLVALSKVLLYSLPMLGVKHVVVQARSFSEVALASFVDILGVTVIAAPLLMVFWNVLISPAFNADKINCYKALLLCLLGIFATAFLGTPV